MRRREVGLFLASYVVLTGLFVGVGFTITGPLENTAIDHADKNTIDWFVRHRTPTWTTLSSIGTQLSETWSKILVTVIIAVVLLIRWKRWFEAAFISMALVLEALVFVTTTSIVDRSRPAVKRLDGSPIGSSFPSGHVAAAVAYSAIAVVVFWHTRKHWARIGIVTLCVVVPILVGLSRMYRGMHYPTDVLGGLLVGGTTVIATTLIMRRCAEAPVDVVT